MTDNSRATVSDIWIVGLNMTRFGRFPDRSPFELGADAASAALQDADLRMRDVEVLGGACVERAREYPAQRIQELLGQTGIPAINVLNACATGATAIRVVIQAMLAGEASIGLAVGCEAMGKKGLLAHPPDERDPFEPRGRFDAITETEGVVGTGTMPGVFAEVGTMYAAEHGVSFEHFAKVAEKNHAHASLNPKAQYRTVYGLDEIMASEMIAYPNTKLMCSPTADGAAALVLATGERLRSLPTDVRRRAVKISASVLTSEPWTSTSSAIADINVVTQLAARQAYERAGVGPEDLDLVELHDCFATAELVHYDNLGLCEPGGAGDFIASGAPWRDGAMPVNVSGGLISKGHPLGATGVANLVEVATHLRGEAGDRQIEGAKVGMTHVLGYRSACSIHILEKGSVA